MRKLLLASVAALGVTAAMADPGLAQYADDDSGQAVSPAPGTITVRLNGRFRAFGGIVADGDANRALFFNPTTGAALSPVPFTGAGNVNGLGTRSATSPTVAAPPAGFVLQLNKNSNYTIQEYARLFPGFDGVAANGLKYGASLEIRQDNASGAGGGVYGTISQQARQRGELYLRREWGYVGTDRLGTVRFGATDGPSGLFMTGNFENFNDGGWNGDVNNFPAGRVAPSWPFADVGQLYTTNKVIYLSPQFYGIDFGAAFEPSSANVGLGSSNGCNGSDAINAFILAGAAVAGAGCDRLASTSTADFTRRRNTADVGIRYRGTFGPVGLAANAGYVGGGTVADSTIPLAVGNRNQVDGLSVGMGGVAVTYAGFTVGGMGMGGRVNGQWVQVPEGAPDATAWLAGASYTFGPVVVGTSFYQYNSAGASGPLGSTSGVPAFAAASNAGFSPLVGQLRERGVAAGGTYSVAPGLALFLSYLWGDRKEDGVDLLTTQQSTVVSPLNGAQHNYVKSQVFTLGTSLTW